MSALTGAVVGLSVIAAQSTRYDGWVITEAEVTRIFKATGRVARHYPPKLSQKALDWATLTCLVGYAGGTRLFGYGVELRRRQVEAQALGRPPASVHHLRPVAREPAPEAEAPPIIVPDLDTGGDEPDLAG